MTTLRRYNGTSWELVGVPSIENSGPAATLAYAELTSLSFGLTTTIADLPGLSVTVTVPAGRRLRVTGKIYANTSVANQKTVMTITDGANVDVQQCLLNHSEASINETLMVSGVISPAAGTITFKLRGVTDAGTSTVGASTSNPAFILVEDITGSTLPYNPASVPVGQLGYAERTSDQTGITTIVPITGLSVNIVVPAGRVLRITAKAEILSSASDDKASIFIRQDGTLIQAGTVGLDTTPRNYSAQCSVVESPAAGAHTYTVDVERTNGTGSLTVSAGTSTPAFLLVEDITPTPSASSGAPGSTLGYAETNTPQTFTADADITGLSVTVTVPAGRRLRVSCQVPINNLSGVVAWSTVRIMESSVELSGSLGGHGATGNNVHYTHESAKVVSPSAGTHTYYLRLAASNYNVQTQLGATRFAYILVEDITGSLWPTGSAVTAGMVASEAWTDFIHVPTPTSGAFTTATGAGRYIKIGRTVHYSYSAVITTVGTGSGDVKFTLPIAPHSAFRAFGHGRENGVGGGIVVVYSAGGSLVQIKAAAALANGHIYDVAGTYESAT